MIILIEIAAVAATIAIIAAIHMRPRADTPEQAAQDADTAEGW